MIDNGLVLRENGYEMNMQVSNNKDDSSDAWRIIWFSIGLGALYWFIDCFTDVYIFHEGTLASQIFSPHPHELWMRFLTMSVLVALGVLAQQIIAGNKRIKRLISESEQKHSMVLNKIDEIVYFVKLPHADSLQGTVEFVSERVERIIGYKPEEFMQNQSLWLRLIHPDDIPLVAERTKDILLDKHVDTRVYRLRHKATGEYIWVEDRVTPQTDGSGRVTGIFGVARDITERRKAEERIEYISSQWQTTFDSINDAIFIADAEGRILRCNKVFADLVNKQISEIIGYTCHEVVHGTADFIDGCPFVAVKGTHQREIVELIAGGKWFSVTVDPVMNDSGEIISYVHSMSDVTERKQIEGKLKESEEEYRHLFQYSPIGVFHYTNNLIVTKCNKRFAEIVHLDPEQIIGLDLNILKVENVQSALNTAIKGEKGFYEGLCLLSPVPMETFVTLLTAPIFNREGMVKGGVGIVEDITERRQIQEALQKTTQTLQLLIKASPAAIIVLNTSGEITMWSPAAEQVFGWKAEEVLGRYNPIVPEEKKDEFNSFVKRISEGESFAGVEVRRIRKDGSYLDALLSTAPVYDQDGRVTGIMGVLTDISERKKMEEQVFDIKRDWEDTFNIITDMITVHDADFNIIRYNKAAEKILGLSILNVTQEKCYKFYHGTGCPPAGCPSCLTFKTGVPSVVELFEPHLNMFIEIRAIPRLDSEGKVIGLIHVVRDITEHKKLENHLRQSQKMEAIGQLAGGVAHDFNNIITAIVGYASIMKMKAGESRDLRALSDQVLSASEKAANLVQSLLAFSREQAANPEPVKLNEIIKSMEKLLAMAAGDDIELKIELTDDLTVMADIVQIEQVMMNLCTNARDAMPAGGTLTVRTGAGELTKDFIRAHGYGEEGRYAHISVSDTGVGMDERIREKIFEPFFTTKEFGKGTGLGLSIVYGIIKNHKGYIICRSEPGRGTTFDIYLPLINVAMKEVRRVMPPESARTLRTILLADDEDEFRRVTRDMLGSSGYDVIEAVDGEEAVIKFKENKDIDLLLFDIIMPKMSGREAYDKIKKIKPDIKVLFISGYPSDFTGKYGVLEEGMNFIQKPAPPATLLRKITEVLGNEA
jgi:PAS domain S-box-containing protein